jgi:branched-chain amino acid transport system substrate-binding protein
VNVSFTNAYKARFNALPDNWAALGYALGTAAATAIRNAGPNPTRARIRDEMIKLRRVPVPIGSGLWTLDEQRNPTYGGVILTVKNGNFTRVQW